MASITSWTRLESNTNDQSLEDGLAARFHDPLWTLARQWQTGEFEGTDGGSPVGVRVRTQSSPLDQIRLGPAEPVPYAVSDAPLEALVEREWVRGSEATSFVPVLRERFSTGLHFQRLLASHGVGDYRSAYAARYALAKPLDDDAEVDAETRRMVRSLGGRVPDGPGLYSDLRASLGDHGAGELPSLPRIAPGDRPTVTAVAVEWLAWYDSFFTEPRPSDASPGPSDGAAAEGWNRARMTHTFGVSAAVGDRRVTLASPEYDGGRLDWYTFDESTPSDTQEVPSLMATPDAVHQLIPVAVEYAGMPSARWWELEDPSLNFARLSAASDDLLRMLLIEFALQFGNDWFVIPLEQQVGTMSRITSLVVTDSFGTEILIPTAAETDGESEAWRWCGIASTAARDTEVGHLLAPTLPAGSVSDPIETVHFLRDEMANLAWAVETTVEGGSGRPYRRDEIAPPEPAADPAIRAGSGFPASPENLSYTVGTPPARHWVPLVPVRVRPGSPAVRLRRGRFIGDVGEDSTVAVSRILNAGQDLEIFEEEVPSHGAAVMRYYQQARWIGGQSFLWLSRARKTGAPRAPSEVAFDVLSGGPLPD